MCAERSVLVAGQPLCASRSCGNAWMTAKGEDETSKIHYRNPVYTIGHSTRTVEEVAGWLTARGVRRLIDVRSYPNSRHCPQWNQSNLLEVCPKLKVDYTWMRELGGRRKPRSRSESLNNWWQSEAFRGYADYMQTDAFASALQALVDVSQQDSGPVAIMCSEAVWWRCHRSLVSDALVARGCAVVHIMSEKTDTPHKLRESGRVGKTLTYPPEEQPTPAKKRRRLG